VQEGFRFALDLDLDAAPRALPEPQATGRPATQAAADFPALDLVPRDAPADSVFDGAVMGESHRGLTR
jgi:hypothetical protein